MTLSTRRLAIVAAGLGVLGFSALAADGLAEDDPIVASVNGENIHRSEVEDARDRVPVELKEFPPDEVFNILVESLIDNKLTSAAAGDEVTHRNRARADQYRIRACHPLIDSAEITSPRANV